MTWDVSASTFVLSGLSALFLSPSSDLSALDVSAETSTFVLVCFGCRGVDGVLSVQRFLAIFVCRFSSLESFSFFNWDMSCCRSARFSS